MMNLIQINAPQFLTWVELAGHVAPFSLDVLAIGEHSIDYPNWLTRGFKPPTRGILEDFKSH
jgi:hypothetical protein